MNQRHLGELIRLGRVDLSRREVRDAVRRFVSPAARSEDVHRRDFALRASPETTGEGRITGIASAYNFDYDIGFGRKERILRGAFRSAEGSAVPLLYAHDWQAPPIGVARVREGSQGLLFDADVFMDDQRARSVFRAAEGGALYAVSIGFIPTDIKQDGQVDVIRSGDLAEVSLVVRAANPKATVTSVRSRSAA